MNYYTCIQNLANVPRNIIEGSGGGSPEGHHGHRAAWAPPGQLTKAHRKGVAESPSKSDWSWSPTRTPPLVAPKGRRGVQIWPLPSKSAEVGRSPTRTPTPPSLWRIRRGGVQCGLHLCGSFGRWSPTRTPEPCPSRFGRGEGWGAWPPL